MILRRGFSSSSPTSPSVEGSSSDGSALEEAGSGSSLAPPPMISFSRHSANRFRSFAATSCWTPRPNWAARPVSCMSVSTCTFVEPFPSSCRVEVMVAEAVPCPRASLPSARITARCSDSSASSILTVPWYSWETGPSRTFISPLYSSPDSSVRAAPGRQGVTRSRSSSTSQTSSTGTSTVNSFSSFMPLRPPLEEFLLQTLGEPTHDLLRYVFVHSPAELGDPSGKLHVGLYVYPDAAVPLIVQSGRNGGGSGPLTAGVLALGPDHSPMLGLVGLLDLDRPVILGRDRPHLD